uniref:Uncharacterized protein n=1 Tax=Panthera tigris altaica TaxID=74533 RepID=A0A8C9K1W9_PANTA
MDGWLTDSSLVLRLQISDYIAWQFSTRTNFFAEGHTYAISEFTASPSLPKLWVLLPDCRDAQELT